MPRNSPSQSVLPFADSECRETHPVKALRPLRKEVWCRTSSRSIHAQEGSPAIQTQLNFGNWSIEVGMPRNSRSQSVSPFAEGSKHTCSRGISRNSKATEFRQPGHRSQNAAKLTESKRFAVCGRKCDVEQVAEAYMLKTDHPKFKATEFRQPGHRSRNAMKLTESKPIGASKSECRETHRVKVLRPLRKEVWCRTCSRSIHAQEGSPEIQRQLNFGNRGIEVGMPPKSPSQSISLFEEGSKHTCSRGITRNSKATEFRQPGHRSQNAAKLTESYRFAVCGSECDVEPVAEAYMLKRDHQKLKGNKISATGASKSECRETHRVKAFRRLRKEVRNAAKLIESKRFAVCGSDCDVEQIAEAYMLKRDHLKFKGNCISATGASKPECRETHPVKALRPLRKEVWCRTSSRSIHAQEGSPEIQRATEFRQPGHRSRNAAKTHGVKAFRCLRERVLCRTNSRSIHAQEGSPEIQRQLNFGNRVIKKHTWSRGITRNSKATEFRQSGLRSHNAAKLTESYRFAVCGSECDVEPVAEAYMLKRDHQKFKGNRISATGASKS
ncbi:hypothetical protein D5086_003555 [Populus alba]|uniref:Uncharacterized protein n=1 Tax=Populus alba TaxID=43335 RepID=A0ACC4D5T8_POPAL